MFFEKIKLIWRGGARLEIVIAAALFTALALCFWVSGIQLTSRDLLTALGSAVSTFIGAWFAFRFNSLKEGAVRLDREIIAGNLALSTLAEFWDRQKQYQIDIVKLYRGRDDAWFNLAIGSRIEWADLSFNRSDLAFLLLISARSWQKITLEERRFRLLAQRIDERDTLILNEAWPKLVAAGMQVNRALPTAQLETLLGPSVVRRLQVTTEAIISHTDENVASSLEAFDTLRNVLLKNYPGKKFINLDPTMPSD